MGGARSDRGQVLALVALSLAALLGMAALAIDVGRFYSERRFLQNAADAAALAAGNAIIRGESYASADQEARDVLTRNFLLDPNGQVPTLPPATPVYESGYANDAEHLTNGILIGGGEVRVAIQNAIQYTFGRILGFGNQPIGARARVKLNGDLLPIAVRRYINPPGPNAGATSPCSDNPSGFMDFFATDETACLGTDSDASLRTAPSAGNPFDVSNPGSDPVHHGPVVAILGQGAQPNNGADFRGFVALDIRNFASSTSQLYYNGVTPTTNTNTLKALEAGWVATGYPGPLFPPAITPPDPNDQVGVMSGNSTGVAITAMNGRYGPGSEILVAVYPGSVMAIPDFAMTPPAQLMLPTSGMTASAGSLRVSRNQAFSGTVTLSTLADTLDPANPMVVGTLVGSPPITYSPNPVTPSLGSGTAVALQNVQTSGATPGIYVIWIQGQAGSPYLTIKQVPVSVMIGSVTRDFTLTASASTLAAANPGDTVSVTLQLTNSPNKNTDFGNPVALSVDGPLPSGMGPVTFGSASVAPTKAGASTTLTINTGTLAPGSYEINVRATAMNADPTPAKVTHLLPLTVTVAQAGSSGSDNYVDIVGFAVMRVASGDSNAIYAYAITPVVADMQDPQLYRGQAARLVPWN